jgi:hypothetical protein
MYHALNSYLDHKGSESEKLSSLKAQLKVDLDQKVAAI